jgi:hypothetical protein
MGMHHGLSLSDELRLRVCSFCLQCTLLNKASTARCDGCGVSRSGRLTRSAGNRDKDKDKEPAEPMDDDNESDGESESDGDGESETETKPTERKTRTTRKPPKNTSAKPPRTPSKPPKPVAKAGSARKLTKAEMEQQHKRDMAEQEQKNAQLQEELKALRARLEAKSGSAAPANRHVQPAKRKRETASAPGPVKSPIKTGDPMFR